MLTEEQIEKGYELYGENIFELPQPTFIELMQNQLASPIVIFQLFCAFLWALDTYWKYTMFTLMSILGFEASTAFSRLKTMSTMRGMGEKTYDVYVFRRKAWEEVNITELLPGDLLSLSPARINAM